MCILSHANPQLPTALYEAKQDVARHLVKRQKLDHKIAQMHALVTNLQNLSAELDRKNV